MFFSRVTSRFINHPRVHSSIWFSITMLIPSAQLSDDSRVSRQRQRNFTEFRITCMIGIFVEIFRDKSNAFVNYRIYDLPYRDINYTKLNESCSSADIIFFTGIHRWHATTRITFRRFNSEETQHTRPSPRFSFLFSFFFLPFHSFAAFFSCLPTRYHFSFLRASSSFLFNPSTSCYNEIYTCALAVVDNSNRMSRVCYDAKVSCCRVS